MNLDAIGLSESDEAGITALKEISEKQEEYLPVVQVLVGVGSSSGSSGGGGGGGVGGWGVAEVAK